MIRLRLLLIGCGIVAAGAGAWAQAVSTSMPAPAVAAPSASAVPAAPAAIKLRSLMFTPDQVRDINRAFDRAPAEAEQPAGGGGGEVARPTVQSLSLSALLYTDAAHWTVWVNGVRLVPGTESDGFRVVAVSKGMVEFELDGPPVQRVRLRPNETYQAGTGPGDNGSIQ